MIQKGFSIRNKSLYGSHPYCGFHSLSQCNGQSACPISSSRVFKKNDQHVLRNTSDSYSKKQTQILKCPIPSHSHETPKKQQKHSHNQHQNSQQSNQSTRKNNLSLQNSYIKALRLSDGKMKADASKRSNNQNKILRQDNKQEPQKCKPFKLQTKRHQNLTETPIKKSIQRRKVADFLQKVKKQNETSEEVLQIQDIIFKKKK